MMDFSGKTALITGGVSGIGFGIARAFANAGMDLILTHPDHREDFTAICAEMFAALPDEPIPEGRAQIERLRRGANRAAIAGMRIGLADLS